MQSDPLTTFSVLWRACLSDDDDSRESLLTFTAVSFALGMVASVATVYFLGAAHLIF
jgi:hypothetical protein